MRRLRVSFTEIPRVVGWQFVGASADPFVEKESVSTNRLRVRSWKLIVSKYCIFQIDYPLKLASSCIKVVNTRWFSPFSFSRFELF